MMSPGLKLSRIAKIPDAAVKLAMLLWSGSKHAAMVRVTVCLRQASSGLRTSRPETRLRFEKRRKVYLSQVRPQFALNVRDKNRTKTLRLTP